MPQLVGSLIRASQLTGPLLILDRHAAVSTSTNSFRLLHAFIALTIVKLFLHASTLTSQVLAELEPLGCASQHIMQLSIRVEPADYLILRRHVQLLHDAVKFLAQFDILRVERGNLAILLR